MNKLTYQKLAWVRPKLERIVAGSAEVVRSTRADGGGCLS
jgi:hypothetical protein